MTSVIIVRSVVLFKRGAVKDKNVSVHISIQSFIHSFIHLCIHSCSHSFICWCSDMLSCISFPASVNANVKGSPQHADMSYPTNSTPTWADPVAGTKYDLLQHASSQSCRLIVWLMQSVICCNMQALNNVG